MRYLDGQTSDSESDQDEAFSINSSTVFVNVESSDKSEKTLSRSHTSYSSNISNVSNALDEFNETESEKDPLSQLVNDNIIEETSQNDILAQPLSRILDNDSEHDQQNSDNESIASASESLADEFQVTNEFGNPTPINFEEIMNTNLLNTNINIGNDTEVRKSKPAQNPKLRGSSEKGVKRSKSINKAIRNHKHYSIDSSIELEIGKDLAEYIPGLYRLLDLCEVDGSNSPVEKIILSKDYLQKLCNDMVTSSFKSISEVDYTMLNSVSFRLIGCYGNRALIAKFLLSKKLISQLTHDLLVSEPSMEDTNKSSLRPGIYLLVVDQDLGLIINWPKVGCYEEGASPKDKNDMIILHRYLTKLTDCQLCLMSSEDLKNLDWNLDSDDESEACYEFEVKKSREELDEFIYEPGFKMDLSQIKDDINNDTQCDVPLHPVVVESTTEQSFITRKMAKKLNKNQLTFSTQVFSTELHNRLKGHSLCIDRESMNMNQLKSLIIHGFETENNLLEPYNDAIKAAKSQMEMKKDRAKEEIEVDAELITKIGWKNSYSLFETFAEKDDSENNDEISEKEINRIQSKHPEVKDMIKKIKITSSNWTKLKQRYALAYTVTSTLYRLLETEKENKEEIGEKAIKEFYDMFIDKETNIQKLVEKYERKSREFLSKLPGSQPGAKAKFDKTRIKQVEEQVKQFSVNKSDSEFIQSIQVSSFFRESNHIKQNVLGVFSNEYQNWRRDNFPNSVKAMVPTFSYNQKLLDNIKQEFSQDKKEIEAQEFERICNKLEKDYNDGTLRLNILSLSMDKNGKSNNNNNQRLCLTYEVETNQLQITIHETFFDKADVSQIKEDEFYIPNPILNSFSTGKYGVDFQIDPIIYDFRQIHQFDDKFLLVLYNKKSKEIEIFFNTAQMLTQIFEKSDSIVPFKTLETNKTNLLIAVNEPKELIATFDTESVILNVYSFDDNRSNLYIRDSNIELLKLYNNMPKIKYFLFIKDTEELCFVEENGRARIFNLVNKQFRPAVCKFPLNTKKVLSSPDGSCIVAFATIDEGDGHNSENDEEMYSAYVYFCPKFGGSVDKVINMPLNPQYLQFTCVNKLQTHLVSFDLQNGHFGSLIVKITNEKNKYRFQERKQKGHVKLIDNDGDYTIKGENTHFEKIIRNGQNIVIMGEKYNVTKVISDTKLKVVCDFKPTNGFDKWTEFQIEPIESLTNLNGLIDVYRLMFEKYPIENCVDSEPKRNLDLKFILDVDDDEIEEYEEKFEDYICENLRDSTKRLRTLFKNFSITVITFRELDVENVKFLKKHSSEYDLGDWIIKLCCLIPVQIAITKNNSFQPLKDELPWRDDEIDRVDFDGYGHHVDSLAKNISFGWYEGILKHFGSKKVKVVSSMGESSSEKLFMLNHLVGTSFDESSMRSEGVWMSLVNTKKYIYVTLNFKGLEFPEKTTAQEDLFLTLFITIVSNLILFKDQFVVNKDLSMFQRFQNGAVLFEPDSKILQAKLCVIIKDIPIDNDEENIVKEFKSKFSQLISEEGEDNFISKMYKGGLDIIPWPMFNDAAWFKTLSNINKKLIKQETKHENARSFLQNTKIIMAKLKICDWGSLDETHIQIRMATLKRFIPDAISYGLEQRDITRQLVNYDTGEPIDDPEVRLSDIIQHFEESELLPSDSGLQLYDYNNSQSFDQLSKPLRHYFKKIVSRKDSSDDRGWFTKFDDFLKYIIKRRASRVQKWYTQNTAKFPQDNNDIVKERFALEEEISKLALQWTLCGLTCDECGLKCIMNYNHSGKHNCLSNHLCSFVCDFQHNGNIPSCSHKAGHKGDHICDKINHTCGKACVLNSKGNCQKICSKESGHDGEHQCDARHYCGENCSLSTYTRKGDHSCINKCVMPYDEEHETHCCEIKTCPIVCAVTNCQRKCQSDNHFHAYDDLLEDITHYCGNEHPCQELCEEVGVCKVVTVPKQQITFTKYVQEDKRLQCSKKIPPNQLKHSGRHTHEEDGFHGCDAKCKFCGYYCTLPHGHTQILHETRHGNMTRDKINIPDDDNNELEHRHESETSVLCNLQCKDKGRHIHVDYCQNEENCKLGNQRHDIQHINDINEQPHPERPKDNLSHKLFWERTGFKDPYSVQEQIEFAKCNYESPEGTFCEQPLFHAPLNSPPDDYGYILDGHHFKN